MPAESSGDRSVNSVVICGAVTRMMTNPKNPISAAVTATIAITRAAPRLLRKLARPCNEPAPDNRPRIRPPGADRAIIAYGMVSIWLMKVKGDRELSKHSFVMRGLDPRIHQSSQESFQGDGLPGQARQRRERLIAGIAGC